MPTEVSTCHTSQLVPPISPKSQQPLLVHLAHSYKSCQQKRKMKLTRNKVIPLLLFIISSISIIRLLRIAITTTASSPSSSSPLLALSPTISMKPANATTLTAKEFKLLANLVSSRAPCNLLIFGFEPPYLVLSEINAGGTTIILEDDANKVSTIAASSNSFQVFKVEYQIPAGKAYKLLKLARRNPACIPHLGQLELSKCQLLLKRLPREVYKLKWDVVVVDGPRGDRPEAVGRMGTIYTASLLARAAKSADVLVHDVDRMVEKWYSWEFLCDENLVSSKGRFWHFRISNQSSSTSFCPSKSTPLAVK